MKFFIQLSYKGTHYFGWQRQPRHPSVQQTLEEALEKMLGYHVNCIGCGRTDTGVHASQYFCHIKVAEDFAYDPVFRLNKMLPDDIAIHDFIPVPWEAHAQHDALSRTYTYRLHTVKNAFDSELSAFYPKENMDLHTVRAAVETLGKYHDFRSFCRQPAIYKTTVCQLSQAALQVDDLGEKLTFTFTADRFLRGMVRYMVGQILEVAYGRVGLADFENLLKYGLPPRRFKSAHPQGLYLSEVRYGFLEKGRGE